MPRIALPDRQDEMPATLAFSTFATKTAAAALNFTIAAYQNSLLSMRELEGARYRTALICNDPAEFAHLGVRTFSWTVIQTSTLGPDDTRWGCGHQGTV